MLLDDKTEGSIQPTNPPQPFQGNPGWSEGVDARITQDDGDVGCNQIRESEKPGTRKSFSESQTPPNGVCCLQMSLILCSPNENLISLDGSEFPPLSCEIFAARVVQSRRKCYRGQMGVVG